MKKWEKPMIQELNLSYTMEDGVDSISHKPKKTCFCKNRPYLDPLGCGHKHNHGQGCPKNPTPKPSDYEFQCAS